MKSPAWTEADIADLSAKVALVTGANSGIGFETARALSEHGAKVLLACRNAGRAQDAAAAITRSARDADLQIVALDLADLTSISSAATNVAGSVTRLDLLINNAGIMGVPRQATADGFEMQFGTNHLGHFALTARLWPLIKSTGGARVVTVSSNAHKFGKLDFEDLMAERRYGRWRQYGRSKLSNLLFSYELQRRLERAGERVAALAAHPGTSRTGLADEAGWSVKLLGPLMAPFSHDAAAGALPTLRAAVDPEAVGGSYYGPSGLGGFTGPATVVESNGASHDRAAAERLWEASERLTGIDFRV